MKKISIVIILFALSVFFPSCDYFKMMNNKEWMEITQNDKVDVYVCGQDNYGTEACYWKNGEQIYLPGIDTDLYLHLDLPYNVLRIADHGVK